jgi:hypothetical protein
VVGVVGVGVGVGTGVGVMIGTWGYAGVLLRGKGAGRSTLVVV